MGRGQKWDRTRPTLVEYLDTPLNTIGADLSRKLSGERRTEL